MLNVRADIAIVVGGYNSSNTSHLVELCEQKLPTYFIDSEEKILSAQTIMHYNFHNNTDMVTQNYLPYVEPLSVLITSGASCPDALVEGVIKKLAGFFPASKSVVDLIKEFE
jgi:4-hydroxy-3-methylbut-2-enyl diphosphate reductase